MTAVVIGCVFIFLGGWGLLYWFQDFLTLIRGLGPISVLVGGLIALVAGISSFRASDAQPGSKE
ncbi:MAG: hypothetical protein KCHDKBKB_02129 [Elusimicrobia bacterium]|nr:hypothetical protein [Elusimicrobiota bacterium]